MKRRGLIFATLGTLSLTGFVLTWAGWFSANSSLASTSRRAVARAHGRAADPLLSEAAIRWRRCQANHWRACLLQP